ncbi:MAG: glycosyltransferase family 2 protein [Deltaproteobacteria bacterium]|nr:glycosyltransferase family 2 protein [Deltaproteobacteria bacterium]
MINQKKVLVVLPAYNAEKTLERTYREIPRDIVDQVLLVDDDSSDRTVETARRLGIESFLHDRNYGYGRNQKTCYREALKRGADIIVMLHPDYQYTPKLLTAMASMIAFGVYDVVLGSRIIGGGTGPFRGKSWKVCRYTATPTISSLTTRCWPRSFTSASAWARYPAPPATSKRHRPSACGPASSTAWAFS